jgi:hypothetical protein
MKRDDLGLANEPSVIGQKIYAVGSLIGSKTDCDSDPTETNNGVFLILADLSKRLEKISRDVEAQALSLNKKKPEKRTTDEQQVRPQLFLVKEAAVS